MCPKKIKNITLAILTVMAISCFPASAIASQSLRDMEELDKMEKTSLITTVTRSAVRYGAIGLRDPFKENLVEEQEGAPTDTYQQQVSLPSNFTIQGIIWGGRMPQAIINNKVVKVGDTVEGAKVITINKNGIVVFYNNRNFDLSSPAVDNLKNIANKSEGGKNEGNF